jgi:ATP-dependent Clp protease ATP-binding subunit ClpC
VLFERFTDQARRVMVLAKQEARMLNHNYIGTEHILLGLIHEGDGVAAKALERLNVSLEAARRQVEEIIGQGRAAPTGHIPFTPRAKKVLELSFRESRQLGHNHIGTEHILLGLIYEGEGVAADVLQKLGASLTSVRQAVIRLLSGSPAGKYGDPLSPSPFEEREKVVLSFLINEGLSRSELATLLGVSEEKVGEIVRAVIEKLKDI